MAQCQATVYIVGTTGCHSPNINWVVGSPHCRLKRVQNGNEKSYSYVGFDLFRASLCFVSKTRGFPSQRCFPAIRSSPGWTLYRQWPRSPNRFSSLLPSSNSPNQRRSLVHTARTLYRRGRQLINGKAPLTSFVPPPASPPSLTSVLQRNEV